MRRTPESRAGKPAAFEPPRYIAIEGPLRVGKTTLARFLADRMHARRIMDCEDNPFLPDFYSEKGHSAFRARRIQAELLWPNVE
jgi:deoxyadenosine/deoxycytidine kinase